MIESLDGSIKKFNFRPLIISRANLFEILLNPNFDKMGIYAVSLRSRNVNMPMVSLRYVLFDQTSNPYSLDGGSVTIKNTQNLIKYGFKVKKNGSTSFVLDKDDLHRIFHTQAGSIPTDETGALATQFVVFSLCDESTVPPALPVLDIRLYHDVIAAWLNNGSGPAAGARGPAPIAPVVPAGS